MPSSLLRLNWSLFGYRHADETNAISKRQACCAHSESVSNIIFTITQVEILQLTVNSQWYGGCCHRPSTKKLSNETEVVIHCVVSDADSEYVSMII